MVWPLEVAMKFSYAHSAEGGAALGFKLTSAFSLIFFTLTFSSAVYAAELVVNGGFELPVVDPDLGWMTYYGQNHPLTEPGDCPQDQTDPGFGHCNDDTRVTGWSVYWSDDYSTPDQTTPGRLEIQTGIIDDVCGCDGSLQKAELDSHHRVGSDNNNVAITQLLPTCPFTAYKLTYAWKSRTDTIGDNDTRVFFGGQVAGWLQQNTDWQFEEFHLVTDDSDEALLEFQSVGTETTLGMYLDEVSVTGPDGSEEEPCTLVCDDKPMELTLRYDGEDDTDHQQTSGEVIIYPELVPSFPNPAVIKVYGHNSRKPQLLGTFDVPIDGFFSVSGPHKRIPPRMVFVIYHPDDLEVPFQTITFHTSCSQPMDAGDEFGAITVWSAVN